MNDFAGEIMMKEKIKNFQQEGMTNQAYYQSRTHKAGLLHRIPGIVFPLLVVLGLLTWLWH
jgi:hypothetical protein